MSKSLITQLQEQEVITNNFLPTKKEIQKAGEYFVKNLVQFGDDNLFERYSEIVRIKEAVNTIESELKKHLPDENFESFGVKGTYRNGGGIANYSDDPIYASIQKQLENRKVLLDAALKTDEPFYDNEGVEVPKVSKTERKSSLSISF